MKMVTILVQTYQELLLKYTEEVQIYLNTMLDDYEKAIHQDIHRQHFYTKPTLTSAIRDIHRKIIYPNNTLHKPTVGGEYILPIKQKLMPLIIDYFACLEIASEEEKLEAFSKKEKNAYVDYLDDILNNQIVSIMSLATKGISGALYLKMNVYSRPSKKELKSHYEKFLKEYNENMNDQQENIDEMNTLKDDFEKAKSIFKAVKEKL